MTNLVESAGTLLGQNPLLAYLIIYLTTIFLGNISAFASFWIVFRGYLGPWGVPLLVFTLFCSNITGDLMWYTLGRTTRNTRFGRWIHGRLPSWHDRVERTLEHKGRRWIILSKFMYAAAFPVIFSAGWVRMDFRRFIKISLLSVVVWIPILLGLTFGLVAGLSPLSAISTFRDFEAIFIAGLVIFIAGDVVISKLLARTLDQEREQEEEGHA